MAAEFWAGYISGAASILIGNPLDLVKTRVQAGAWSGPAAAAAAAATLNSSNVGVEAGGGSTRTTASTQPLFQSWRGHFDRMGTLVRGTTAPLLTYGFLNAVLYWSYTRSLHLLQPYPSANANINTNTMTAPSSSPSTNGSPIPPPHYTPLTTWTAGAIAGLATFFISTPTEVIKCRAQMGMSTASSSSSSSTPTGNNTAALNPPPNNNTQSSIQIARTILRTHGIRGLYTGGTITAVRDAVGYGFYFWSYEVCKATMLRVLNNGRGGSNGHNGRSIDSSSASGSSSSNNTNRNEALAVLLSGGIAGIVTWASIFPLDVIKTRIQTYGMGGNSSSSSRINISCTPTASTTSTSMATTTPLLHSTTNTNTTTNTHPRTNPNPNPNPNPNAKPPSAYAVAAHAYRTEGVAVFFRGLGVCSVRAFVVNAVQWGVYEWMMRWI